MKFIAPPVTCALFECPNTTSVRVTGHPLHEYCARCRATIQKYSRGSEPGDYSKGIAKLWSIHHECSWCGGKRATGPDEDKDPICDECKARSRVAGASHHDAYSAMEVTCQVA